MFISADYLSNHYGINHTIARFFADREPPRPNLYWRDKELYLGPAMGYLFIPFIVDLLHRAGMSLDDLLGDKFVDMMEKIGNIAAKEEAKKLTVEAALENCITLSSKGQNKAWHEAITGYFTTPTHRFRRQQTIFPALHRGDYFLFALSAIQFDKEYFDEVVSIWFELITTLLLMDDLEDVEADAAANEPNAVLQARETPGGEAALMRLAKKNLQVISSLNRTMAATLDNQLKRLAEQTNMKQIIKQ